jgi:hypothetical protein
MLRAWVLSLFLAAATANAGVNSWTPAGPWGPSINTFAVSRQDRSLIYAGTRTGIYRSGDAGREWRLVYPDAASVHLDPNDARVVYAQRTDGLRRSDDGGATWTLVTADRFDALRVAEDSSLWGHLRSAREVRRSTDGGRTWQKLAYVNATAFASIGGTVYATSEAEQATYRTADGGATWEGVPGLAGAWTISASPAGTLFAEDRQVLRSTDGVTWTMVDIGPVTALTFDSAGRAYAISAGDLFTSNDDGQSWQREEVAPEHMFLATAGDDELFIAYAGGLLHREAGGTWRPSDQGMQAGPVTILRQSAGRLFAGSPTINLLASGDGGGNWSRVTVWGRLLSLSADPIDSSTLYAGTDGNGVYVSGDGGATWPFHATSWGAVDAIAAHGDTVIISRAVDEIHTAQPDGTWKITSRNGRRANINDIAIDPNAPSIAYATTWPVQVTLDGGQTWSATNADEAVSTLLIVPGTPSLVLLGGARVLRASSGSATFTVAGAGLPSGALIEDFAWNEETATLVAAVTPQSPSGASTELWVSRDLGETWTPFPVQPNVGRITEVEAKGSRVWAGTSRGLYEFTSAAISRRRVVRK